jgi:hypothetical protein
MFKARFPPAAFIAAALCLLAAVVVHVVPREAPPAAATKAQPMKAQPYRLDDGRRAPAEATLSGQLHSVSYQRAEAPRAEIQAPASMVVLVSHAAAGTAPPAAQQRCHRVRRFLRHPLRPWLR